MPTETLEQRLFRIWKRIQEWMDIQGDVVMLGFTAVIVLRIFNGHAIDNGAAACYATAIGALGYSKGRKHDTENKGNSNGNGSSAPGPVGAPLR